MERFRKYLISVVFMLIVFIPLCLQLLSGVVNKRFDVTMKGYFDTYEKPEFSLNCYVSGEYQTKYEAWLNNNLQPRNALIKLYRQIRFSMFHQSSNIVGTDNYIYQRAYIISELCLEDSDWSNSERDAEMQTYVDQLVQINDYLANYGKVFIVYTTSSKAHWYRDNIPYSFRIQEPEDGIRGIDSFRYYISQTDVPYLDSDTVLAEMTYPTFYSTGIHWSRPAEQLVTCELIRRISEITGGNYIMPRVGAMNSQSEPYWRDTDVYNLENLIFDNYDDTYYEYDWEDYIPDNADPLNVLIQGGSFSLGLYYDYFDRYSTNHMYRISYAESISSNDGVYHSISSYDDLDFQELIDNSDVIILEINEGGIKGYSSGYVSYLCNFLASYSPQGVTNFDPSNNTGVIGSEGCYSDEGDYAWIEPSACISLTNENISNTGLEVSYTVPGTSLSGGSDVINIYVNDELVDTTTVTEAGQVRIVITPEQFTNNPDNDYSIRIESVNYCNPSLAGYSADDRNLALKLHYVGEVR